MFREAYNFLCEILDDEQINQYVLNHTGKNLAVINAGAKVTAPCVSITLNSGSYTRRNNSNIEVEYLVSFALPFWGADAFVKCVDFVDFILPIFFDYRDKHNFIIRANPSINELDAEGSQLWAVELLVTISALI